MKRCHVIPCLCAALFLDVTPSPADGQDAKQPVQYRLRQVMMEATISPARDAAVRRTAEACLEKALAGQDFTALARRWSEEPGADRTGGDLGFFHHGDMVKPFSDKVFSMKPGEIAGPVKTQFGYHVIKLLGVSGDTRHAQHILFKLTPGKEDSLAVLERLSGMRRKLLEGASFRDMLKQEGVNDLIRSTDGYMVWQKPEMMLPSFAKAVAGLKEGDISEPFVSLLGFHIVLVDSINYNPDVIMEGFPPQVEENLK